MAAVTVETWPVETGLFIADRRIPELEWYTRRLIGSNARQVAAETQHKKEEANGIGDPAQGLTVEGLSFERKRYKLASIIVYNCNASTTGYMGSREIQCACLSA